MPEQLVDSHGRVLRDLRVSVTDRCNFRCLYCLPETEEAANFYQNRFGQPPVSAARITRQWSHHAQILTFEEIERIVTLAASLGIEKVRLTGGEPLLRENIEKLVEKIARIPGIRDLALTSNGFFFPRKAAALRDAGLRRISFSLDSLDSANFKKITGRDGLASVLESIDRAKELGLLPVKVNAVMIRGINDNEIESLAEFALQKSLAFRFIEFMPLDSGRAWHRELVVPGREILQRLQARYTLKPLAAGHASETARRWSLRTLLRPLQSHSIDSGWENPHLPLQHGRTRFERTAACGRAGRGDSRFSAPGGLAEGGPPPHRRGGFHPARPADELHRRLRSVASLKTAGL